MEDRVAVIAFRLMAFAMLLIVIAFNMLVWSDK